jgi:hypothetical protein
MARVNHSQRLTLEEEALTVLFCLVNAKLTRFSTSVLYATNPSSERVG